MTGTTAVTMTTVMTISINTAMAMNVAMTNTMTVAKSMSIAPCKCLTNPVPIANYHVPWLPNRDAATGTTYTTTQYPLVATLALRWPQSKAVTLAIAIPLTVSSAAGVLLTTRSQDSQMPNSCAVPC